MESQVLVLRKEVKIALAAAAGVVGIALVYGLMATLSSSSRDANTDPAGQHATGDGGGTLDVTGNSGGASSEQIVSGLPPREDAPVANNNSATPSASADPFAESARNDGKNTVDWASVLSSGRVPVDATPAVAGPRSNETGIAGPASANTGLITTRTPTLGSTDTTTSDSAAPAAGTYVIQPGDNFSRIAGKVYGNKNLYKVIVDANPNVDPARLKPGMTINVPARDKLPAAHAPTADTRNAVDLTGNTETTGTIDATKQYKIAPGDTLHKISLRLYGKSNRWSSIYDLNKEKIGPDAGRLKVGTVLTLPEPPASSR